MLASKVQIWEWVRSNSWEAMMNASNYSLDLRLQGSLPPGIHTQRRVWVNNICVGMII